MPIKYPKLMQSWLNDFHATKQFGMESVMARTVFAYGKATGIVAYWLGPPAPCRDWNHAQATWEESVNDLSEWRIVGVGVA